MSKTWTHGEFVIEEGMKPHDDKFKDDHYQYFIIAKRGEARIFKYCIWMEKAATLSNPAYSAERTRTGHKIPEAIYQQAIAAVRAKIDAGDFGDRLLRVSGGGIEEVDLDSLDDKVS